MPGATLANALEEKSCSVSLTRLKLGETCKENVGGLASARWGLDDRLVEIMCPLEAGHTFQGYDVWHFKGVFT